MDFRKSFEKGILAAKNIEKETLEIRKIFVELQKQIKEASHGRIKISIENEPHLEPLTTINTILKKNQKRNKFYIVAESCSPEPKTIIIAEWKTSNDGGFPCFITYDEHEVYAYDEGSLIIELQNLISSPYCGNKFRKLIEKN